MAYFLKTCTQNMGNYTYEMENINLNFENFCYFKKINEAEFCKNSTC